MKRRTVFLLSMAAGVASCVTVLLLRDRTPLLRPEALAAAQERWKQEAPASYTIAVLKEADRLPRERFVTEVRDGQVVKFLLDGNPLPPRDSYTVPALFSTMERELELASGGSESGPGAPRGAVLKAVFDERLGLPVVFKRLASRGQSFLLAIEEFEVPGRGVVYPR